IIGLLPFEFARTHRLGGGQLHAPYHKSHTRAHFGHQRLLVDMSAVRKCIPIQKNIADDVSPLRTREQVNAVTTRAAVPARLELIWNVVPRPEPPSSHEKGRDGCAGGSQERDHGCAPTSRPARVR